LEVMGEAEEDEEMKQPPALVGSTAYGNRDCDDDTSGRPDAASMVTAVLCTAAVAAALWFVRWLRFGRSSHGCRESGDGGASEESGDSIVVVDVTSTPDSSTTAATVEAATAAVDDSSKSCANCGALELESSQSSQPTTSRLLRCARCKSVFFCSAECQRRHWPSHRPECKPTPANPATCDASPDGAQTAAADATVLARQMKEDRANVLALRALQDKVTEASTLFWQGAYRDAVALLQTVAEEVGRGSQN